MSELTDMKRYAVVLLNTETQEILSKAVKYKTYKAACNNALKKASQIMYRVNPSVKWCIYDFVDKTLHAVTPIDPTIAS